MMKLLLINPSYKNEVLSNIKSIAVAPLNLAILANNTPEYYEVKIIDEQKENIDFDIDADIVGITCMTSLAPRAYEISNQFRKQGIKVILGGIHASMMSQEAINYADSVVIGEAENIWPVVLQDFEKGRLKKIYTSKRPKLENLPLPRRDLLNNNYLFPTIQTSRGCPYNCNFCSVTRFNGGSYRFRSVEDVINEISQLKKRFIFIDDNIVGTGQKCTKHVLSLFTRLKDLKKEWGSQICITIADNKIVLDAAAKSGAKWFYIGFESVEAATLIAMNKKSNLKAVSKNLNESVKKIQDSGIAVIGGFMFGSDTDTRDTFNKTIEFVFESELDGSIFMLQTPLPGTGLYEKYLKERRLLFTNYPKDWKRYNGFELVYQPKNMTIDELEEGFVFAYESTAKFKTSLKRSMKTFFKTNNIFSTLVPFFWNYNCYKIIMKK